ncbi:YfjI family protein [Vibrio sp. PNB22_4_1]
MNHYRYQFPIYGGDSPRVEHSKLITNAFNEAKTITQAPDPMVYLATINAASVALQGVIDVELPTGKVAPVSLMSLIIAESGERKSSLENLLTKGIKSFHKESIGRFNDKVKEYNIREMLFEKKKYQIEKSFNMEDEGAVEEMVQALLEHENDAPKKPKLESLSFEDSTAEALLSGLSEHVPNAYLGSSEGGVLLNSRLMSHTASLNALWTGDEVTVSRKTAGSFTVEDARLTINIMTQWSALERFLTKNKDDVRGNGFLSRFLVCAPQSNCGFRQSNGIEYSSANLAAFNKRLSELMFQASELTDYKARRVVRFSNEAKKIWLDIANDIEFKMAPEGAFEHVKDHASKLPENIARLAALIHSFDDLPEEDISKAALLEAIDLMAYFSGEFIKVFAMQPKYKQDAENLYYWFNEQASMGVRYVKRNKLLQFGPNGTRNKKALDLALEYLKSQVPFGEVLFKKTKVIDLSPHDLYDESKLRNDLLFDVVN